MIKVTEGSQLAIAPVDYPEPKKVKNTAIPSFSDIGIDDPTNSEHDYIIAGSNGNITSAFYNTQGNAKVQITRKLYSYIWYRHLPLLGYNNKA